MVSSDHGHAWMGPLQYPNDAKQILIVFVLLPFAAIVFSILVWKSAMSWM
jgi:hypothetical protein